MVYGLPAPGELDYAGKLNTSIADAHGKAEAAQAEADAARDDAAYARSQADIAQARADDAYELASDPFEATVVSVRYDDVSGWPAERPPAGAVYWFGGDEPPSAGAAGDVWARTVQHEATEFNRLTNPSLETGTTGWGSSGDGMISHETTSPLVGTGSLRLERGGETSNAYATAPDDGTLYNIGDVIEATVKVRNDSGRTAPLRIVLGQGFEATAFNMTDGEVRTFDLSYTAVSDATEVRLWVGQGSGEGLTGDAFVIDSARLGGATYADGDFPGWEWTGTAGASTSQSGLTVTHLPL